MTDDTHDGKCPFRKPDGSSCGNNAGHRTEHPGIGCCFMHGGNTRTHVVKAAREQVARLGAEADIEPDEVLLRSIRRAWAGVLWCTSKTEEIETLLDQANQEQDFDSVKTWSKHLLVFQQVYGEWIDRAAKLSKLAIDAGIEQRRVAIAEEGAQLLATVIRGILTDLNLTQEQQLQEPRIVRKHLALISAAI